MFMLDLRNANKDGLTNGRGVEPCSVDGRHLHAHGTQGWLSISMIVDLLEKSMSTMHRLTSQKLLQMRNHKNGVEE
jgi:hypothetical protein